MIISHEHRFIFVKTKKTAGTSIEVFLAGIAGADALVTPIDPPVAGHTPRNFKIAPSPARRLLARTRLRAIDPADRAAYFNHISAREIQGHLGRRRWNSYFTFCFERNPWEKTVSRYFFAKGRGDYDGTFHDYVLTGDLPSDFDAYSLDGTSVGIDFVGRYEHLEDDLKAALERIGVDLPVSLTREKGNFRPAGATSEATFDDEMSRRIESSFAREIQAFGYTRPERLTAPPAVDGAPGSH